MKNKMPNISGKVKIEVITDGTVVYSSTKRNTLVKEAPKILLGNIIGQGLLSGKNPAAAFTENNRPTITPGASGPTGKLSITHLSLGYYEEESTIPTVTAAATNTDLGSTNKVHKLLTDAQLTTYGVEFICSFTVTADTADYNYIEAGLQCAALSPVAESSFVPLDPDVSGSGFSEDDLVLFAHQTHDAVQGQEGSTIRYTWTISMDPPA